MAGKKDIAGKIVDYLRQNGGTAVINYLKLAIGWDCTNSAVSYSVRALSDRGVISTSDEYGPGRPGSRRSGPTFTLAPQFGEGEGWRDVLRNQTHKEKKTSPGTRGKAKAGTSRLMKNENGPAFLELSRELVNVYERLQKEQKDNDELQVNCQRLGIENDALKRRVKELEEELESEKVTGHRNANEVAQLDLQLRELRSSTKQFRYDRNGFQA